MLLKTRRCACLQSGVGFSRRTEPERSALLLESELLSAGRMDLLYMSDVMAYQTIRNPMYDKYTWDQSAHSNETKAQAEQKKNKVKEPCKICKEKQRRSLMKYIRSKSHDHSEQNIREEEEEEEGKIQVEKEEKEETKR